MLQTKNYYKKTILFQEDKQIIKEEFYKNWKTCEHEMLEVEGLNTITPSRQPLFIVLKKILQQKNILTEITQDYTKENFERLLKELKLKCPTCGKELTVNLIVGKYLGDDEFWHSFNKFKPIARPNLKNRPKNTKIKSLSSSKSGNEARANTNQINNNLKVLLFVVCPQEKQIGNLAQNKTIVSLLNQIASGNVVVKQEIPSAQT